MTEKTTNLAEPKETTMGEFDISKLKQTLEAGDVDSWAELLSDDYEQVEMFDITPPSNPTTYNKAEIVEKVRGATDKGVKFTVENLIEGGDKYAFTVTCHIPNGRKVISNMIGEVKDGKITHDLSIGARDPEK